MSSYWDQYQKIMKAYKLAVGGEDEYKKIRGPETMRVTWCAYAAFLAAKERYPSSVHNGDGDALRHGCWNAYVTRYAGAELAEKLTRYYEDLSTGQPEIERKMDLFNNKVGREIISNHNLPNIDFDKPGVYDELEPVKPITDKVQEYVEKGRFKKIVNNKLVLSGPGFNFDSVEFDRVLKKGNCGYDVKKSQMLLVELGFDNFVVNGEFEDSTYEAVVQFQKEYGLDDDGVIGSSTISTLLKAQTGEIMPKVIRKGRKGPAVTKTRQKLQILGFDTTDLAGVFGDSTFTSVVLFQQKYGLEPDGIVGPLTMDYIEKALTGEIKPVINLGIKTIEADSSEPFNVGENVRFKVQVKNYKSSNSPKYKVVVYDENGHRLDYDNESSLSGRDYDYAYLDVTMNNSGEHRLKFAIEVDGNYHETDNRDNVQYKTYRWKTKNNGSGSGVQDSDFAAIAEKILEKGEKDSGELYFVNKGGISEPCRKLAKSKGSKAKYLIHNDFKEHLAELGRTGLPETQLVQYNGVTAWKTCAQVDTDGSGDANDHFHLSELTLEGPVIGTEIRNGKTVEIHDYFNAFEIPFIVIPMYNKNDVNLGALGIVINIDTGNYVYVVYADRGPAGVIGEGSVRMHQDLGIFKSINQGFDDESLVYIMFDESNTKFDYKKKLPTRDEIQDEGKKLFETFIKNNNLNV